MENREHFCSFCGKPQRAAKKFIASPNGQSFICDECVVICKEIIKEEDPAAFFIVGRANEIYGSGYKNILKERY